MWCWHCSKSFKENTFNFSNNLGITVVPILQMRKVRHGEAKELAQSYLANTWQSQYSNADVLAPDEENLALCLVCGSHTTSVHSLAFWVHNYFFLVKWDGVG